MLSKNIRILREGLSMSQTEVAQYLDVTPQSVSNYENDARGLNPELITKLALLFNVEEFELFEENPHKSNMLSSFAFRSEHTTVDDLKTISEFKKIINNFIDLNQIPIND